MSDHFCWDGSDLLIRIRVSPRASRDKVGDLLGDRLKVSVTAPPVDGQANARLTGFIAKQFGVAKSQVSVVHGESNRNKTVRVSQPRTLPAKFQVTSD